MFRRFLNGLMYKQDDVLWLVFEDDDRLPDSEIWFEGRLDVNLGVVELTFHFKTNGEPDPVYMLWELGIAWERSSWVDDEDKVIVCFYHDDKSIAKAEWRMVKHDKNGFSSEPVGRCRHV